MANDSMMEANNSLTSKLRSRRSMYQNENGEVMQHTWGFVNEPISSYEESFKQVLGGKRIVDFIKQAPEPIVIDLMAQPRTVHDLLSQLHYKKSRGLAVTLNDTPPSFSNEAIKRAHAASNIDVQYGDITDSKTWGKIREWLGNKKADLIMERAMGGLMYIPNDKKLLSILVNNAWSLVNPEGGVMLFETPRRDRLLDNGVDVDRWIDNLREANLDIAYDPGRVASSSILYRNGKIFLRRTPESPEILPSI